MQSDDKMDLKISASFITEVYSWLENIIKKILIDGLNLKMKKIERQFRLRKIVTN